jgi:hypothetical protein
MKINIKSTAMSALFTLVAFFAALQGALAQFPGKGDDSTQSLGQFNIIVNPTFQGMMAGYPGYSPSTHIFTSPVLFDATTDIGRSVALHVGDPSDITGVPVGGANVNIGQSLLVVEPGGLEPVGTREVHTMVYSLNMTPFGSNTAAVRAGTFAPDQPISPGEVESLSGSVGLPANDFPAQSFFDVFVDVDIAAGGTGFPASTLYNTAPLMVLNTNLTSFPPTVVYIHGMSTAVPVMFRGGIYNGQTFGVLTLAGHGVFQTNNPVGKSTTTAQATTQLQNALAATTPAPVNPAQSGWSPGYPVASSTMVFPAAKGDDITNSLGTFVLAVNPVFQPFMTGYPQWNTNTKRLTSPLLFDQATTIGRSAPFPVGSVGDSNGVPVGTVNTIVSNGSYALIPTLFPSPSNTWEVKTQIRSFNLTDGSGTAVRAGTAAPGVRGSYGEVNSLAGTNNNPYWDFPAKSFFDIFVDVDLPAAGTFPAVTLSNAVPLIVQNNNLTTFPPQVIYVHGNTTAVPVMFTANYPTINAHVGDTFGILLLSGHGVSYSSRTSDTQAFQQAMAQLPEQPVAVQYATWAPGLIVPVQFSSITSVAGGGAVLLNGYCSTNASVTLQSTTSLSTIGGPVWQNEVTTTGTTNGTFSVTRTPGVNAKFYRMVDNTR